MVSLIEVKRYLNKTDTARDDELQALTLRAIDAVQTELDWYFGEPRNAVEVLNGNGDQVIYLRQPVVAGSLTVENRSGIADTWETVSTADYEVDGRLVQHATYWARGLRNWRFTYQEGFDEPPGDVVRYTLRLIAAVWLRPQSGDVQSETLGRYSYTRGDMESTDGWPKVWTKWRRGRI